MHTPVLEHHAMTRIVQKATNSTNARVADWNIRRISNGGGEAAGIYRVSGTAWEAGATFPWTLILKVLQPATELGEPSRWNNDQREALAYSSGFLDGLGGALSAPSCVEMEAPNDGSIRLWLEDVDDAAEGPWQISRYGLAAYHLGRFNARHTADQVGPAHPWFSRNWMRGWTAAAGPYIDVLSKHRQHPFIAQMYDVDHILGLWGDRHRRLDHLENLPQALCHLDAFRGNLFSRRDAAGQEQTIAIDWAFVGYAALGEELASLVAATVAMGHVEPQRMDELESTVLEAYQDGLSDEGCLASPVDVYDAYALSASMRLPVGALRLVLPVLLAPDKHQQVLQQHGGTPLEELLQRWGAMNEHLRGLG